MASEKQLELLNQIVEFSRQSEGLELRIIDDTILQIRQRIDGHSLFVDANRLNDLLYRTDIDGRDFVQVNFHDGLKILITHQLIGFKPVVSKPGTTAGAKLPRVVTTPDMMSVLEAMEEAGESPDRDLTVLRELFDSIVRGAERVGFDVNREKAWLLPYLTSTAFKASA